MSQAAGVVGANRKRTALIFFGLFALSAAAYGFSLDLGFMCDDYFAYAVLSGQRYGAGIDSVFYNLYDFIVPSEDREFPQALPWWTSPDTRVLFLRPLTSLSLKLDYRMWGRDLYGYHLTNITVHGLACAVLFLVGRILLRRDLPAALAALVFAGHLYHVSVVPWVADRGNLLAMLLGLTGLYAHILYRHGRSGRWELLAWGLFILAFLSRESGAVWLIAYFLYDLFLWRSERPERWPGIVRVFLYYCVLSIPLFLFMGYFVWAGYGVDSAYSIAYRDATTVQLVTYVLKNLILYALALLFFAPVSHEVNLQLLQTWHYLLPVLALLAAAVVLFFPGLRRGILRMPLSLFLLSWMFFSLLPTLALLPQNRLAYPATAAFGLFIGHYLFELRKVNAFGRMTRFLGYGYLIFLTVVPLLVIQVKQATFTRVYGFLPDMIQETQVLLQEAGVRSEDPRNPVRIFFINVPSFLYLLAIQEAFDFHLGHRLTAVFPLTVGHDVPEVTLLGDRSLRITSHSQPFLESAGERLFLSRSVVPNRVGFSTGNRYVRGSVEQVEDGKITSIRFDFPDRLDDEDMRFFFFRDRRVRPLSFPEDLEPGRLLEYQKSVRK